MLVFRIEETLDYNDVQPPPAHHRAIAETQMNDLPNAVFARGLYLHHQEPGKNLQGGYG